MKDSQWFWIGVVYWYGSTMIAWAICTVDNWHGKKEDFFGEGGLIVNWLLIERSG